MSAQIKYGDIFHPVTLNKLHKFWPQYGKIITTEKAKIEEELWEHLNTLNNICGVNSQNINILNRVGQSVEQNKIKYQQLSTIQKEHERINQILGEMIIPNQLNHKPIDSINEKEFNIYKSQLINELIDLSRSLEYEL